MCGRDQEYKMTKKKKKPQNRKDKLWAEANRRCHLNNEERVHSGKFCFGKTPMQTFSDSVPLVKEKMLNKNLQAEEACLSG